MTGPKENELEEHWQQLELTFTDLENFKRKQSTVQSERASWKKNAEGKIHCAYCAKDSHISSTCNKVEAKKNILRKKKLWYNCIVNINTVTVSWGKIYARWDQKHH